jgi:predicted ArsR family transcriptional regulator
MQNIILLAKSLSSENRYKCLLGLIKDESPVDIAMRLDISRAGLQKHLESLLGAGLIHKTGGGRNTKYRPTVIVSKVIEVMEDTGEALRAEREVLQSAKKIQLDIVNAFMKYGVCPP